MSFIHASLLQDQRVVSTPIVSRIISASFMATICRHMLLSLSVTSAVQTAYGVLDDVRYLLTPDVTQTCTAPILSKVIVESGHFCNPDPMLAHARQQETVCLMTAIMAQPLGSEFSSLALARINEHHNKYGDRINSDTVLWLSWYRNSIWSPL